MMAKKGGKPKGAKGGKNKQVKQEKASVQEARFDAATRQYMFTMLKCSKKTQDGKQILKDVSPNPSRSHSPRR